MKWRDLNPLRPTTHRPLVVLLFLLLSPCVLAQQTEPDRPPDPSHDEAGGGRDASGDASEQENASRAADPSPQEGPAEDGPAATNSGFAEQLDWLAELASAYRLRDELDSVLSEQGRASSGVGTAGDTRLAGLATRCVVMASSTRSELARAVILNCQARANAELARFEADGLEQARQRRLKQVRAAAEALRLLDVPGAGVSADYWETLADLADTAASDQPIAQRHAQAEQFLNHFIRAYAADPAGREFVTDARLSLARLLDERGDQRGVAKQLDAIGELPEDSPRRVEAERLRAGVARIGKPIKIEAVTTRLSVWRLSDFAGQPVLVHVYADAVQPSVVMIEQIQQAIASQKLGGAAVVSLRVGEPVPGSAQTPWPTLPIDLQPDGILDRLGIEALPTLIWIDARGKIASIGHLASVLDQMPGGKPEDTRDSETTQDPKPVENAGSTTDPDAPSPQPQPAE